MSVISSIMMAVSMYFINDGKAFYKMEFHHEPCLTCATEVREYSPDIIIELKDADLKSFCIIDDIIAYDSKGFFIYGKRQEETEQSYDIFKADKRTLQSLGGSIHQFDSFSIPQFDPVSKTRYHKDKNNVYNNFMIMENVDAESFNKQVNAFPADKYYLYDDGKPLKNSDGSKPCKTLTTGEWVSAITNRDYVYYNYIENNNNIYINSEYIGTKPIEEADPKTFTVLADGYSAYSKDKSKVYFMDQIVKNADPETFEIIQVKHPVKYNEYARDKRNIYYKGGILKGFRQISDSKYITDGKDIYILPYKDKVTNADIATFEPIDEIYAKDCNNLYDYTHPVKGFDITTFIYLHPGIVADKNNVYKSGSIDSKMDASTLQKFNNKYFKDKNHVYFGYQIVKDADPETFRPIDDIYAVDKNNLYQEGKNISWLARTNPDSVRYEGDFLMVDERNVYYKRERAIIDPKSYKALNLFYSIDKNGIYYYYENSFRRVTDADKESFEILSSRYARDKNNVYYEGLKLYNSDPHTFQVLCDTFQLNRAYRPENKSYLSIAKDKNNTYLYAAPQPNIIMDAETFKIHDFDFENHSTLISDKTKAYSVSGNDIVPTDADIHTFAKYHSAYYKDKNNVYMYTFKIPDADRDSFRKGRALNYKQYYIDKNHVYCEGVIQEHLKIEDYTMD